MKYFLSLILSLFLVLPVFSAEKIKLKGFFDIDSENFEMNISESTMLFTKEVKINFDNFNARCERAEILIEKKTGKVKKIIMTGNVKIIRDNSEISGEKVYFEPEKEKLLIEGKIRTRIKL